MPNLPDYELLISSISHEIRNPVTLINSYLQLMADIHPEVLTYRQWQPIQNELGYLCRLLGNISDFNNCRHLQPILTDSRQWLMEYAGTAEQLVHSLGGSETVFQLTLGKDLPLLSMDPVKIRQILDNLIRNSVEAIHAARKNKQKTAAAIDTITLLASVQDQSLVIQVSDTGCGIEAEDLSSVFQPFVSHKSQGSGLGLAISARIAQAHGGALLVHSVPGQGAVFTLRLPIETNGNASHDTEGE